MHGRLRFILLLSMGLAAGCTSSRSGLNGCFYVIDGTAEKWSVEQWRQEVGYLRQAGLLHVIVTAPASTTTQPTGPGETALDRLMSACAGTGLRVYLSLWAHPQWYARWNLDEELSANKIVLGELSKRYRDHPNLAGWYIPHETYATWGSYTDYLQALYLRLSTMCKEVTPDKKVILSPFFILDWQGHLGDFRFVEPAAYEAFWYGILRPTKIDIVALQDSGEHLSCYTMDERRPFLAAMKRACDRAGKSFWVNVETGELEVQSYEDYERRFGRKTHVNDARTQPFWRVVPPEKLRRKLQLAHELANTTITWGYQEYWDPMRGSAAKEAYDAYASLEVRSGG